MVQPRVCVLKTDGINRDEEMAYAFTLAGGLPQVIHINTLAERQDTLQEYQILGIPGGFSYGDDVAAGKVLAVELLSRMRDQFAAFVERGGVVLGVCNGFQVLVRTGLLPFGELGHQRLTLALNSSAYFECRWVRIRVEVSNCVFTQGCAEQLWEVPVAHGEGRLSGDQAALEGVETRKLVTLRFVDGKGNTALDYPANPNGSPGGITGLTDPTGRVMGLMPHPECFVLPTQHPNWRRRGRGAEAQGVHLFSNAVRAVS